MDSKTAQVRTMTLGEYADARESVVLFWAGVGSPAGSYTALGEPECFAECLGLLGLSGTLDDDGDWRWDGEGDIHDHRGNTIYKLHAYIDAARWEELAGE